MLPVVQGRVARCRHWLGLGKTRGAFHESSLCHSCESCVFFLVWECLGFNVKTKLGCWGMDETVGRGEPQVLTSWSTYHRTFYSQKPGTSTLAGKKTRLQLINDLQESPNLLKDPNQDLNVDAMRFDTWNRAGKLVCELLLHGALLGCASQSVRVFFPTFFYIYICKIILI